MTPPSLAQRLAAIDTARADGTITDHSARTMRAWLTEPRYVEFLPELAARIDAGAWKALDDVYWTVIPFGTGGRRGTM
jgi:phosphoglucomutase/phosphomannomutase